MFGWFFVLGPFGVAGSRARGGVAVWIRSGIKATCYLYRVIAPACLVFVKVGVLVGGCEGGGPLVCFFWAGCSHRYVAYCLVPPFRINIFWC